ncbi:hypothetical protein TSOC_011342, partial [Tetrabaena socialis]
YRDKLAEGFEARGSGGSILSRAINKELLHQCDALDELSATLSSNSSHLDTINISTAWVKLAKLQPPIASVPLGTRTPMPPEVAPLVRLLMGKTLATIHDMTLRQLANCLYGMGRASVKLEAEPNGQHLAAQVEQRLLELAEKEKGLADGRDAAQLWYSLRIRDLPVLKLSLQDIDDWDASAVGQVCLYWGNIGIQLAAAEKELFTQRVVDSLTGLAETTIEGRSDDEACLHALTVWVPGAYRLRLQLPAESLKFLHELLLAMPPSILSSQHQSFAEYGARRRLSVVELTNSLVALSHMSAYVPTSDAIALTAVCLRDLRGCTQANAAGLLRLMWQWRVPCTEAQLATLKRVAEPNGGVLAPGGGSTRQQQQGQLGTHRR